MEKLQAALQKARQNRESQGVPTHARANPAMQRAASTVGLDPVDQRWQNLTPFDVDPRHLEKHRVVTREASPAATPFDILRTKVLLQMRQNGWRRLAITSPMPSSGKTTTACNLALGLGRQRDLRAILLDLDLRDPSVNKFFQAEPRQTIGRVLSGDVDFADQALRIGDNIAVSMARRAEEDPTRLLLAEETTEVIDRIESEYNPDLLIFDLPSVLVNDDTRAFLKHADCALIVIRAGQTRYGQFDTCEREIGEQTNVLGVVLNAYMNAATETASD
jgi:Mrp family chromosome partitioning ATPase